MTVPKLAAACRMTEMATRNFLGKLIRLHLVVTSGKRPLRFSWAGKGLVEEKDIIIFKPRTSVTLRWQDKENPETVIRITVSGLPPGRLIKT
jgi:hypothetical protein